MKWLRDAPIKRKLLSIGLLTSGLALLLISLILTAKDAFEWRNRTVAELTTYARVIGSNAAPAMLFDDRKAAAEILSALSAKPDVVHAVIYDRDGNEFAAYQTPGHSPLSLPHIGAGVYRLSFDNLIVSSPFHFKGELIGSISLESDLRGLYTGILRSIGLIFLVAFGVFLVAAFLFAKLQKIIVTPILDMAETMRNVVTEQNFAARAVPHGKDEIGALADTFNAMLGYIQLRDALLAEHREHLEEEVTQRTARLTEAQRIAHLGDWELDIADKTLSWSDEIYRIFGLEPQQFGISYEAFLQAVHPEDRQFVDEQVSAALEQGQTYSIDHRIVRPDGAVRYVHEQAEMSGSEDGHHIKMLGTVQDITERKEFEEELKRSNVDLEQFSYAVSHDMRQPLRMISSYLQLLERSLAGQLDDEKRGYFGFAIEGAKRIDQMLVALLEYSRVGRMGEPPTMIDSRAVLDEALQFLQPAIAEARARLSISGEWPHIMARRDEVLRLMQNLIGNAIKYRIAGRTPEIAVISEVAKNEWRLCVADNGVGIIPNQIKRLFQVFQRLQSREAYEGTGIGLALCRKIAEHHKGRIWAESAGEGKGSKFCVVLPVLGEKK
jgi:PAS domain S-box-containing protein